MATSRYTWGPKLERGKSYWLNGTDQAEVMEFTDVTARVRILASGEERTVDRDRLRATQGPPTVAAELAALPEPGETQVTGGPENPVTPVTDAPPQRSRSNQRSSLHRRTRRPSTSARSAGGAISSARRTWECTGGSPMGWCPPIPPRYASGRRRGSAKPRPRRQPRHRNLSPSPPGRSTTMKAAPGAGGTRESWRGSSWY